MRAAFEKRVLAAAERKIAAVPGRAVVAGENDDGVVAQAELVEFGEDGGDVLVHRLHHRGIDALGFVGHLRVHALQVRVFRLQRRMDDVKRHVAEERAILVLANELQDVPRDQVLGVADVLRAVLAVVPPTDRAASPLDSPREVIGAAAVIDPGLVEAVGVDAQTAFEILVRPRPSKPPRRPRRYSGVSGSCAVVPFAEDAGAVAVGLECFGDGGFFLRQLAAGFRPGADAEADAGRSSASPASASRRTST